METQTKVQIITRNTIKPSTPTSHRNRILKLSFLDQIYTPVYGSLVLFYTSSHTSISKILQKSLSETLVHFYPFAGRVRENISVDCSDQGACFVEARAECKLSETLREPDPDLLRQFIPIPLMPKDFGHDDPVLLVQLTHFSCGGIAIAVSMNHKIADAVSLCMFAQIWSSVTRGNWDVPSPDFIGPSLLPPLNPPPVIKQQLNKDLYSWATRRFVFHTSKLAALKAELTKAMEFKPTNVELVSAILFRRLLAASRPFRPTALNMAVNLRPKTSPPLPENSVGNLVWTIPVLAKERGDTELHVFLSKLRKGLVEFFDKNASKFKGEDGIRTVRALLEDLAQIVKSGFRLYTFTSLCKFPLYETDFGWGKPAWVTSPMHLPTVLLLTETKSGDGIEVWATLEVGDMAILERDEELLAFASLNPSITGSTSYCRM